MKNCQPLIMVILLIVQTGCAYEPVKPWQRSHLVHPTMKKSPNTIQEKLEQHTYGSKEGTSGGSSTGSGGCGCN